MKDGLESAIYLRIRNEISIKAQEFISKLTDKKLKSIAIEMACLNAEYFYNHKDSTNISTQEKLTQMRTYGFTKGQMGMLISIECTVIMK